MEVSKNTQSRLDSNSDSNLDSNLDEQQVSALPEIPNINGSQLIDTLVTLTGLPEPLAHQEMDEILNLSGHDADRRSELTLDDLRQALITYLETLRPTEDEEAVEQLSHLD